MSESIHTHSVARGFAQADDIELNTTARTRIIFRAGIHSRGVRGRVIRQKIGTDGTWKELNEVNFNRLPADCGVSIELDTVATAKLYAKLAQLYSLQEHGVESGDQRYVVAREDEVLIIDDRNKAGVIRSLLDQGHSEDFWDTLSQRNPDLASRLAAAKIQFDRQETIRAFEGALTAHANDEQYWQGFFEAHPGYCKAHSRLLFLC